MTTKSRKSSATITGKRNSKHSSLSLKKDRHSTTSREKRSTSVILEEDFNSRFTKLCKQFKPGTIPFLEVIPYEPLPGCFPPMSPFNSEVNITTKKAKSSKSIPEVPTNRKPTISLIYDDYVGQTMLNSVIMKNFKVDKVILIILRKTFQLFGTLRTLKLENCRLENTDLRTLKTILLHNRFIQDLSINGNPNPYQNFFILLKNTRLENLSMRFCQINDRGVKLIARELCGPFTCSLLFLNLSSNFISDEGAVSIAKALRVNRILLSFNLADNWLTDVGCEELINVLQVFSLQHDEIVIRRHRIMNFLLRKKDLILAEKEKLLRRLENASTFSGSQGSGKRGSKEAVNKLKKEAKKNSKGMSSAGSTVKPENFSTSQKTSSNEIDDHVIQATVELQMDKDRHPFVKDSYELDQEIYCKGNFKLMNLNIAYNKMTLNGIQKIAAMLRYQRMNCEITEGLFHMTLEGNPLDETNNDFTDINVLIEHIHVRKLSISSADSKRNTKRKKSGASRISMLI